MICLDDFSPPEGTHQRLKESVVRTIQWAKRSKREFEKQLDIEEFLTDDFMWSNNFHWFDGDWEFALRFIIDETNMKTIFDILQKKSEIDSETLQDYHRFINLYKNKLVDELKKSAAKGINRLLLHLQQKLNIEAQIDGHTAFAVNVVFHVLVLFTALTLLFHLGKRGRSINRDIQQLLRLYYFIYEMNRILNDERNQSLFITLDVFFLCKIVDYISWKSIDCIINEGVEIDE